jgi:hypothetical protein
VCGDDDLGEEIFQKEENEHGDDEMAVWCPRLRMYYYFDYDRERALSHIYDDKPRSRQCCY